MSKKTEDKTVNEDEMLEEETLEEETLEEETLEEVEEETVELNEEDILKKEIEILENEIKTLKEDGLKVRAEADNFKKRLQRDHELSQKYKIQNFALEILPALDNFERALAAETKDEALHEGVTMIYQQLKASLEREGVVAIEALNKEFDPNIHQAVVMEKQDDVEANIVIEEFQKGYMIKDRILRPSMVKVSE